MNGTGSIVMNKAKDILHIQLAYIREDASYKLTVP